MSGPWITKFESVKYSKDFAGTNKSQGYFYLIKYGEVPR